MKSLTSVCAPKSYGQPCDSGAGQQRLNFNVELGEDLHGGEESDDEDADAVDDARHSAQLLSPHGRRQHLFVAQIGQVAGDDFEQPRQYERHDKDRDNAWRLMAQEVEAVGTPVVENANHFRGSVGDEKRSGQRAARHQWRDYTAAP